MPIYLSQGADCGRVGFGGEGTLLKPVFGVHQYERYQNPSPESGNRIVSGGTGDGINLFPDYRGQCV